MDTSYFIWGLWAWQILQVLVMVTVAFLLIRLLIVKNFPRKQSAAVNAWVGLPTYPISIYWSNEDARFLAEVPDLPGCVADGRTQAEALTNAAVVVEEWLKSARELNRPIPAPRPRLRYA